MAPNCFLIDLDGTIWIGDCLIPGADCFVEWLIASKKRFRFITNNSSNSASAYVSKLNRLGIECPGNAVFTSTTATIRYLRESGIHSVFPLGTPAFVQELVNADIAVTDDAGCVLVAFDKTLTYEKADHAFQLLQGGAAFIATHPDVRCPVEGGYILDCGAILAMLESVSGRKAKVLGKPSPEFIKLALGELNASPDETIIVGDRIYTDMRMGIDAGIKTALVLSGETNLTDALPFVVDYIVQDVGKLPHALEINNHVATE
jgi:HAD superfamily hydrolase (TIGR01450 family)